MKIRNLSKIAAICCCGMFLTACSLPVPFPFSLIFGKRVEVGGEESNSAHTYTTSGMTIHYTLEDGLAVIQSAETITEKNNGFILEEYIDGNLIKEIQPCAFSGANIRAINLNGSYPIKIGERAFENCRNLTDVSMSEANAEFGEYAFAGSGLKAFSAVSSNIILAPHLFDDCHQFERAEFNGGCIDIQNESFFGCDTLQEIRFSVCQNITAQSSAFMLTGTTDSILEFYRSNVYFETAAFSGCNVRNLLVDDCSGELGEECFLGCHADELSLNSNLQIGNRCFGGIGSETIMYITNMVKHLPDNAFDPDMYPSFAITRGNYIERYLKEHNFPFRYLNDSGLQ